MGNLSAIFPAHSDIEMYRENIDVLKGDGI